MSQLVWHKAFAPGESPTFTDLPPLPDSDAHWRVYQMSGLGNRFLIMEENRDEYQADGTEKKGRRFAPTRRQISELAALDKGWHQLLTTQTEPLGRTFTMKVWNRDGSSAQNCGNGMRCLAALHMLRSQEVQRMEGSTKLTIALAGSASIAMDCSVSPIENTRSLSIMTRIENDMLTYEPVLKESAEYALLADRVDSLQSAVRVRYGNPHLVLFLSKRTDLARAAQAGEALEKRLRQRGGAFYGDGINISFVQVHRHPKIIAEIGERASARIDMQTWERGAGLTPSCGSGAVAVLYAAIRQGLASVKSIASPAFFADKITKEIFDERYIIMKPIGLEVSFIKGWLWDRNAFRVMRISKGDFYLAGSAQIEKAGMLTLGTRHAA